jgi:D-glycero-alpha-D-manno-heptose-7-phosphate kinase
MNLLPSLLQRLNENLLLFYTGVNRKAETILNEQERNTERNTEVLLALKELAYEARDALCRGNLDGIGTLLHQSWLLKKQLASRISNPEIERLYQMALDAGALGGKITGAGGGGFLLLYCPPAQHESVRSSLSEYRELPFRFEPDGTKVIFNYPH